MEILDFIPDQLVEFVLVTLFALIIGLALRRLHTEKNEVLIFGTDRTFSFIGILGYILFILDPINYIPFLGGGLTIAIFMGIYYWRKSQEYKQFGITTIIVALLTYCIAPLVITQPAWFYILVVVTILILTEMKSSFEEISRKFDKEEFVTLAKFLVIAGVVLPILPNEPIVDFLNLTPLKIWIAVVVISGISYLSYLLRKFVFADAGILISGILGGLYSSTATTIILSRKGRDIGYNSHEYAAAIIMAMAMMYFRILILLAIFNPSLALSMMPSFLILMAVSLVVSFAYFNPFRKKTQTSESGIVADKNPLEFKVALIFMILFVAFSFITHFVIDTFGVRGLNLLSWIAGVSDIDPFLLNLFQGKFDVPQSVIGMATMQAIISNNIMKTLYAAMLCSGKLRKMVATGMAIIIAVNAVLVLILLL